MPSASSPSPLSPADEATLTRLFEINAPSLTDLYRSLKENPLPPPNAECPLPNAPSLLDLFRWSHRPEIKPWLDIHASEQSAAIRRRRIAKLEQIADTSKDLVEQRRACTTALRHLSGLNGGTPLRGVSPPNPVSRGVPARSHPRESTELDQPGKNAMVKQLVIPAGARGVAGFRCGARGQRVFRG